MSAINMEKRGSLETEVQERIGKVKNGKLDRTDVIDMLFMELGMLLDDAEDYLWDDEWGIICRTEKEAEIIADLFDAMYQEGTCTTGTWDADEDKREGIQNEYTGRAYVRTW